MYLCVWRAVDGVHQVEHLLPPVRMASFWTSGEVHPTRGRVRDRAREVHSEPPCEARDAHSEGDLEFVRDGIDACCIRQGAGVEVQLLDHGRLADHVFNVQLGPQRGVHEVVALLLVVCFVHGRLYHMSHIDIFNSHHHDVIFAIEHNSHITSTRSHPTHHIYIVVLLHFTREVRPVTHRLTIFVIL